ncbi:hypothetical protein SHKM778_21510 [Streptomyces sp. KM77-8]|uniref:Uncharacterized protein n=1 Tax=Streptomyces haneummycinicus TaxID=3074435 RepID=A0AAT9HEL8_9ACTN
MGVDQVEPEAAEEQFLGEAGLAPALLPGGLGHLAGLAFGDRGPGRRLGYCGHEAHLARNGMVSLHYRLVLPVRMYPIRSGPATLRAAVRPRLPPAAGTRA